MTGHHDEYKVYEKRLMRDKMFYRLVFVFTFSLIAFSIWYAYVNAQRQQKAAPILPSEIVETDSEAKPLPDFILDKIQPDELEQLKP